MGRVHLVLLLLAVVAWAGSNAVSGSALVSPSHDWKPGVSIFADDFTDDELGAPPSKWTLSSNSSRYGIVKVVVDDGVPSGRAVHFRANKHERRNSLSMSSPYFGETAEGVKVIAIEYWVKYVEGSAIYHYITARGGQHKLMFLRTGNRLRNREHQDGSNVSVPVVLLNEGWNHIRIFADRETNQILFYVNDMENPIPGNFKALNPIETWQDLRIIMVHETNTNEFREAYYSGFKVTAADFEFSTGESKGGASSEQSSSSAPAVMPSSPDRFEPWNGVLRPTAMARDAHADHRFSIPFYQAIPVKEGKLYPGQLTLPDNYLRVSGGAIIPADLNPAALWPDGSIRWLAVDGVWPAHVPLKALDEGVEVFLRGSESKTADAQSAFLKTSSEIVPEIGVKPDVEVPIKSLDVRDGQIHLLDTQGNSAAQLTPRASYIEINKPKVIIPDSVPDDERQYEWAQPLEALSASGVPRSLQLRVREHIVERKTESFTIYRLRGDGGATFPGSELEWQLRVRIYHDTPVVRLEMSWALHWEPQRFALTQAEWVVDLDTELTQVAHAGVDTELDTGADSVVVQSDPDGRGTLSHKGRVLTESDWPDEEWDFAVAKGTDGWIGVGIPKFTRLGPNHVAFNRKSITFASWSERSGYGLDLRPTTDPDEFGLDSGDDRAVAVGVMRTLETSLVWGKDFNTTGSIAGLEARRDTLWFPSRQDLIDTAVFGPWTAVQFETNVDYLEGLSANFHFILASRDRWRWNGWANFGDIRTNFSRGSEPERGLHPGRWALHGRYGWRNGAGQPYLGMWISGLALEDRDLTMAAVDYAYHVADVDVAHGSFFKPREPLSGGMHRRNKDHWSGTVQVQYTPSSGLYLTQWLTGKERIRDTLAEIREFSRHTRGSSAFAASAWIQRYMETHDPSDLRIAQQLINEAAAAWERAGTPREEHLWGNLSPDANLRGLAALYKNNFRLPSDGIPTLTEFYDATRDPKYLEAILTSLKAHGIEQIGRSLSHYHAFAFLLANGITEEEIGEDFTRTIREHMERIFQTRVPLAREHWTYDTLATALGGMQSLEIGSRGKYAPLVLRYFGRPPVEIKSISPRFGMNARGILPIHLELSHPERASFLARVTIDLDGDIIYEDTRLPDFDELQLDTTQLKEGAHTLTVTALVKDYGKVANRVRFNVANMWTLIQNMAPPVTEGWFGSIDFLQTVDRSDGWTYDTGNSDLFFEDAQRLVRGTESSQYAVWETPRLKEAVVTLFVHKDVDWSKGIELAVSKGDTHWVNLEPEVRVEDGPDVWRQIRLTVRVTDQPDNQLFRIVLTEDLPKETIQIGEVVLRGNQP